MRDRIGRCLTVLGVLLAASASPAEKVTRRWGTPPGGEAVKGPQTPPPVGYAPKASAAPKIDGDLSDPCWRDAPVMTLARTLDGSGKAAQPTEVRALHDAATLYLAFRCVEPAADKIRAARRSHDGEVWSDDSMEIFLGFGGTYYHFGVSAAGSTYDGKVKSASWNSGLRAAAARGKKQWTAELAIPLAGMVGKQKAPAAWTANFNRNRHAGGQWQESAWSPTLSGDSHRPDRFGKLVFASPPARKSEPVVKKERVTILPAGGGRKVVRFDLAELPKATKVYRADLLIFRTVRLGGADAGADMNIEIYPLFSAFRAGGTPAATGEPLKLRGPWFDRFDATEAVRQWVAGKTNGGFFLKVCPYLDAKAVTLDVAYEGKAGEVPAQVRDVQAFHRAGQTFITFREIDDPVGTDTVRWGQFRRVLSNLDRGRRVRYRVYRSARPITAANLHQAERIASVRPLSGWNVNGRSLDKAIDQAFSSPETRFSGQWNPFSRASMDGKYGTQCLMERLAVRDGGKPLARQTGLYVHTPGKAGLRRAPSSRKAYYAVVTSADGVENGRDISAANSLAKPVEEVAGQGEPVFQKELPARPFWNYREKRLHYVRWVSPPYVNLPSEYYNWSVAVPKDLGRSVPLELSLHRDGRSYWRTQYRIEQDSVVVTPHDFPVKTWWFGYHESLGTLKSFRQGVVHNYTERRLLAFLDWVAKKWPVDRKRMLVTGCRGGAAGGGALHLGLRHPEAFNLVLSGYGEANYRGAIQALARVKRAGTMPAELEGIWGKLEWDLQAETGRRHRRSVWDELDLTKLVAELPAQVDLPLVTVTGHGMLKPMRDFAATMIERGRALMVRYGVYGGGTLLPVSRTGTWSGMIRQDVRKDLPLPAFCGPNASALYVRPKEPSGNLVVSDGIQRWWGDIGRGCRWKTDDIVDSPGRFEITLYWAGSSRVRNPHADVTLRRLQKFHVRGDWEYSFEIRNPAKEIVKQGKIKPAPGGVLKFTNVPIPPDGSRLIVKP